MNPKPIFNYEDPFIAKLFLHPDSYESDDKVFTINAISPEKIAEVIDANIKAANGGECLFAADLLMIMSYSLKMGWPIPDSLAQYIAEKLQETVLAFGHTDGKVDQRNSAIARALGLTRKRRAATIINNEHKQRMVHCYIWWRIKLFDETLYTASKSAEKAFKGTSRLSHDACEKIYAERENANPPQAPDLNYFIPIALEPRIAKNISFKDDEFLREIFSQVDKSKFPWLPLQFYLNGMR